MLLHKNIGEPSLRIQTSAERRTMKLYLSTAALLRARLLRLLSREPAAVMDDCCPSTTIAHQARAHISHTDTHMSRDSKPEDTQQKERPQCSVTLSGLVGCCGCRLRPEWGPIVLGVLVGTDPPCSDPPRSTNKLTDLGDDVQR